ncbi:MAG: adenosylcobinamide-GDP ribazoletransferase [Janthinobacterium lividum]
MLGQVRAIGADLAAGFGLLTRLPVGWLVSADVPYRPGRAVWTYPLAGLLIGAVEAATLIAARQLGLPPLVGAGWTLVVAMLLTGGLHEDGLADTADGFGGGRTRERTLEIMRDSRIGSYGALALMLSLVIRVSALAVIPAGRAFVVLLVIGALSRGSMLAGLALLKPARTDGLSRGLGPISPIALVLGGIIAVASSLILTPFHALAAIAASAIVAVIVSASARRRIGGHTGDVLGTMSVAVECVLLTLAAAS